MKIGIVTRPNLENWGGDLKAIEVIATGLRQLGQDVFLGKTALDLIRCDIVLLTNTCYDQRTNYDTLQLFKIPYALLTFHEDFLQSYSPSLGLPHYVARCLGAGLASDDGIPCDIERLFETPEIIYYHGTLPKKNALFNYELLKNAKVCIANSATEKATLLRDCPKCRAEVVPLSISDDLEEDRTILNYLGLKNHDYILQVGRLEPRKNPLATIIAAKEIDIPLVFIATRGYLSDYENLCVEAIKKWRKAPTIILSQTLPATKEGHLQIIAMPNQKILPKSWIHAAISHAGALIHPAFSETPGYVPLEAVQLGTATLCSEWCTAKDYLFDPDKKDSNLDGRIRYCLPYDVAKIKQHIQEEFGKRYLTPIAHPILKRTALQTAQEILSLLQA